MNRRNLSLGQQLMLLLAGVVLLSNFMVVVVFMVKVEGRIGAHEERFFVKSVVTVRQRLIDLPEAEWDGLLELVGTTEMLFWRSSVPKALEPLTEPLLAEMFEKRLGTLPVYMQMMEGDGPSFWRFWFDEDYDEYEDTCFRTAIGPDPDRSCPHRIISLEIDNGRWLNVATDLEPSLLLLLVPLTLAALLTLASVLVVAIVVVRRISRPLRQLSTAAERFGRGETVPELPERGPSELATLTRTFNIMQQRLTRFVQDRTRLLGAISHDLRTPITSLRIRAELVENDETRERMIKVLEDMEKMVNSTLDFARLDDSADASERVDLISLLEDLSQEFPAASFASELTTCPYVCNALGLKRAIRNLLDNAVTYGGQARVTLTADEREIRIAIHDRGTGIPESLFEEVFEPFFRVDRARNVESGSVGLGLPIARTVVHKLGGRIELCNRPDGFEVGVVLPR